MDNTGIQAPAPLNESNGADNPQEDQAHTTRDHDAQAANYERLLEHQIIAESFRVNETDKQLMEKARSSHVQLPPPMDRSHLKEPLSMTSPPINEVNIESQNKLQQQEHSGKKQKAPSSMNSGSKAAPVNVQRKRTSKDKVDGIPYILLPFGPHSNLPSGRLAPMIAQFNPRNAPYIPTPLSQGTQSNPRIVTDNGAGVGSAPVNINVPNQVVSAWAVSLPEQTGNQNRVNTYYYPPSQEYTGPRMSQSFQSPSQAPSLVPGTAGTVPSSSRDQSQAPSMASQPSAASQLDPDPSLLQSAQYFRGKIPDLTRLITNINTWGNTIDPSNCTPIEREVHTMAKDSAIISILSLSYRAFEWFTRFAPIKFPTFFAQGKSFLTQRDDLYIENVSLKGRIEALEKERALREEADKKGKPYVLPKAGRLYIFGKLPVAENPVFRCQASVKNGDGVEGNGMVCGALNQFYVKEKDSSFVWIDRVKCRKCRQKVGRSVVFVEPENAIGERAFLGLIPSPHSQTQYQPQPSSVPAPVPAPTPATSGIFSAPPIRSVASSALSLPVMGNSTTVSAPVPMEFGPSFTIPDDPVVSTENNDDDDMESLFGVEDEENDSDAELEAALLAALEEE